MASADPGRVVAEDILAEQLHRLGVSRRKGRTRVTTVNIKPVMTSTIQQCSSFEERQKHPKQGSLVVAWHIIAVVA